MSTKFQKEIESLLEHQVITTDIAEHINAYYASQTETKPNRLLVVFGVLGSLLVGLGIILILAHNWDDFSRSFKSVLAFVPLLIGQLAVGFSILKNKSNTWREASGTFLFFAVGACMALISQIYNIPGNLSGYLLTWTALCVPLVYLLRSNALALLCLVFATYYACVYGLDYFREDNTPWWYLLLLVSLVPFYVMSLRKQSTSNIVSIFNWLFPLSIAIVLVNFVYFEYYIFLAYFLLFSVFYNIGCLSRFSNQKLRSNGYLVTGSVGIITMLLIASFNWFWSDFFYGDKHNQQNEVVCLILGIIALGVFITSKPTVKTLVNYPFQWVFLLFTILFFIGGHGIPMLIINFLIFVLGVSHIVKGAKASHFGILNYGLLVVTLLVVCRFFDTNLPFWLRGLLFLIVGLGFFGANYYTVKKGKTN